MQNNLFGKEKTPVELKESYGGFEVCNPYHIDFKDIAPQMFRWGSIIVEKYDSYDIAKEEFEKEVRRNYETDVKWLKSKFPDSQGDFWLDGIKINWRLKANYIGDMYHFDFNAEDKKSTLLTETGYLSDFAQNLDTYDSVEEYIKDLLHYKINCDDKGKENSKQKDYRLDWNDKGYTPSKQFTLIDMKGGDK